jgi:hypothetical protein
MNGFLKMWYIYIHNGVFVNPKEEWNYVVCRKMNRTGDHYVEWC